MNNFDDLFERRLTYPDTDARRYFDELVGIDNAKSTMVKSICIFLNPTRLEKWAEKYHSGISNLLDKIIRRPPLIILAGDVGTGKTQLAESVGDPVARKLGINITLLPVSLSARGMGRVGEMTKLISSAFGYTLTEAEKFKDREKNLSRAGIILLVDEADALAQSREMTQMHHEDKAGVNAFIRGIDRIASSRVPAIVIMCTNRLSAIDPAIKRRAAEIIEFSRPNKEQTETVLNVISEVGVTDAEISTLAEISVDKGLTYSDLTQRLLPAIILNAYPDKPIQFEDIFKVLEAMLATPAFRDENNEYQ
ncbi:MAG: ATP-binding protein [Gammaproteobacteria bacterium]|nr:ATP-binding protein [Gammaproteobacteria bacterium]MCY4282187.1 ATP-binding protein [Gammaproteobacteria bacterium]MCY4304742.1 ATP-binding protein [Aestuariivita sp.]